MVYFKTKIKFIIIPLLGLCFNTQSQETVDFMSFNIWQEGTSVSNGLEKIRDVIIETEADIICFSEVRNYNNQDWTSEIVDELSALGHIYQGNYIGGDVSIISKFPISNASLVGSIGLYNVQLTTQTISVACAHLDYTYYACYLPRGYNGGSPNWDMIDDGTGNPDPILDINQILSYNLLSTRDEHIADLLNSVNNNSNPIIFMGDFNEPSHLDWTNNTSQLFDHNGLTIPWQNTLNLEVNGFVDAYREYFPNPATHPGITWPSFANGIGSTSWTPLADERERIDYIFHKGDEINTTYAALVGPKESYAYNQITTSHTSNENFIAYDLSWPSDHKALLTTLEFGAASISDNSSEVNLTIFPNPTKEIIQIEGLRIGANDVKIFNILGQELNDFIIINEREIDISELPKGLYLLKIKSFANKVYKL
jgi:endonuclease/exonuclease/phosphatase family metal-dependent hydrolase